jgi:hypothetical protein
MLLELAKPVALLLCILSLLMVFHAAFLSLEDPNLIPQPHHALEQRFADSLLLLSLSAAIAFTGGQIFRATEPTACPTLLSTLPVRIFLWAACGMPPLFFLARFLETHYIFTPNIHW